jgi:hypothetical protein
VHTGRELDEVSAGRAEPDGRICFPLAVMVARYLDTGGGQPRLGPVEHGVVADQIAHVVQTVRIAGLVHQRVPVDPVRAQVVRAVRGRVLERETKPLGGELRRRFGILGVERDVVHSFNADWGHLRPPG